MFGASWLPPQECNRATLTFLGSVANFLSSISQLKLATDTFKDADGSHVIHQAPTPSQSQWQIIQKTCSRVLVLLEWLDTTTPTNLHTYGKGAEALYLQLRQALWIVRHAELTGHLQNTKLDLGTLPSLLLMSASSSFGRQSSAGHQTVTEVLHAVSARSIVEDDAQQLFGSLLPQLTVFIGQMLSPVNACCCVLIAAALSVLVLYILSHACGNYYGYCLAASHFLCMTTQPQVSVVANQVPLVLHFRHAQQYLHLLCRHVTQNCCACCADFPVLCLQTLTLQLCLTAILPWFLLWTLCLPCFNHTIPANSSCEQKRCR